MSVQGLLEESGWPLDIFEDPAKRPIVLHSVDEFVEALLYGDHMGKVVVLKDGITKLGLDKSIPSSISEVVNRCASVREFLNKLDDETLKDSNANIKYVNRGTNSESKGAAKRQRSLRYHHGSNHDSNSSSGENVPAEKNSQESNADEWRRCLYSKVQTLKSVETDLSPDKLYVTELRKKKKYRNKYGCMTKSILNRDVCDFLGKDMVHRFPYWDAYDGGLFVGQRGAGSALHQDQCLWSNVGKNWTGFKLLAAWPFGEEGNEVLDTNLDELFTPPLSKIQTDALRRAEVVALVSPGDVFLFSGADPHATLCVGDGISTTAYESFCNLNTRHISVFLSTSRDPHFEECHMDEQDVRDIKIEVGENMTDIIDNVNFGDWTDAKLISAIEAATDLLSKDEVVAENMSTKLKGSKKLKNGK